jgi:hypothetical protein
MTIDKSLVNRGVSRFVGLFFLFVLALTFLIQIPWIDEMVIEPYTQVIAAVDGPWRSGNDLYPTLSFSSSRNGLSQRD